MVDEEAFFCDILDTTSRDELSALRDSIIKVAEGFIIVYSITDCNSLHEAKEHYDKILRVKNQDDIPILLCGNKCDLSQDRVISKEKGEEIAKEWRIPFLETSAKENTNIQNAFCQIVREIRKEREKSHKQPKTPIHESKLSAGGCSLL